MKLILATGESMEATALPDRKKPVVIICGKDGGYLGHAVCKDFESKHAFDLFMGALFDNFEISVFNENDEGERC